MEAGENREACRELAAAVGRLNRQFPYPLKNGRGFIQRPFCRVGQVNGILGIRDCPVESSNLASQSL